MFRRLLAAAPLCLFFGVDQKAANDLELNGLKGEVGLLYLLFLWVIVRKMVNLFLNYNELLERVLRYQEIRFFYWINKRIFILKEIK